MALEKIKSYIQKISYLELVAACDSPADAIQIMSDTAVDAVFVDINMPDMHGIEACAKISKNHPDTKVIAISNNNENSIIQRMLQSGASGYILKNASADELIQCIRDAVAGRTALSEDVKGILD